MMLRAFLSTSESFISMDRFPLQASAQFYLIHLSLLNCKSPFYIVHKGPLSLNNVKLSTSILLVGSECRLTYNRLSLWQNPIQTLIVLLILLVSHPCNSSQMLRIVLSSKMHAQNIWPWN